MSNSCRSGGNLELRLPNILLVPMCLAILMMTGPALAEEPCNDSLLINPYVKGVGKCIYWLKQTYTNPDHRIYAEKLIRQALAPKRKHFNRDYSDPLNYYELAELIALLNNAETMDVFLTFISPGSEDETRNIASGRLYELRTPLFLERLALRAADEQERIISYTAFGLANNFGNFLNRDNYQRLAVGANWEVLQPKYPRYELAKRIEKELFWFVDKNP